MTEKANVFPDCVEIGSKFKWVFDADITFEVEILDIKIDEDAVVHLYINDEYNGYENDSITLEDLIEAIENHNLEMVE